jgi:hypothetical protein
MSQREVAIVGKNNTRAQVTGQEELLVKVNNAIDVVVTNPLGQEDMAASIPVVIASDQTAIPTDSTIIGPLDYRDPEESVSVVLANSQANKEVGVAILTSVGDSMTYINKDVYSISFASNGSADAIITFDGGMDTVAIPTGTTVNMDAGGVCNYYASGRFGYDTDTNTGASLIITYNAV